MRTHRLLISLLVLASVSVDGVALTLALGHHWPHLTLVPLAALVHSQVSLLAMWVALAGKTAAWRLAAAVVVVALWSWLLPGATGASAAENWAVVLLAQTLLVIACTLLLRWFGFELHPAAAPTAAAGPTPRRRLQFSLGNMLGWMTALAVILGTLQYVAPLDSLSLEVLQSPVCGSILSRTMLALAALTIVLHTGQALRQLALGTLFAVAALALFARRCAGRDSELGFLVALLLLETLLLVGSLLVFRVAGYQLRVSSRREPV